MQTDLCFAPSADDLDRMAEAWRCRYWRESCRPCHLVGADISRGLDGTFECAYGGVLAYGDTPAKACAGFDELWMKGA